MKRFLSSYSRLPETTRLGLLSFVTALVAYTTALLSVQIASVFSIGSAFAIIFHAVVVIVIIAIIVFATMLLRGYKEALEAGENTREKALAYAHTASDHWISRNVECLRLLCKSNPEDKLIYVPCDPLKSIQILVHALYETLEAHFSQAERVHDRIEFEVTFMTHSYIDGKVTIAAWANRDGRMPTSLSMRKDYPHIYDMTVAAQLYRVPHPSPRVIEDTFDPQYDYSELYDHQRDRIRSSIIYPVLSDENGLLGALVMHCDKPKFFLRSDLKYWRELLEIFAKRIVLEKLRLDKGICIQMPREKINNQRSREQILNPF